MTPDQQQAVYLAYLERERRRQLDRGEWEEARATQLLIESERHWQAVEA